MTVAEYECSFFDGMGSGTIYLNIEVSGFSVDRPAGGIVFSGAYRYFSVSMIIRGVTDNGGGPVKLICTRPGIIIYISRRITGVECYVDWLSSSISPLPTYSN